MSEDQSATIGALAKALSLAQGVMSGAKKDRENPAFRSKYADLAAVWDACREALSKNGLAIIQTTEPQGLEGVCVVTTLIHESGEWVRGRLFMPVTKRDAHGFGSAITYARRFALAAVAGISPEDDDANGAALPKQSHGPIRAVPPTHEQQAAQLHSQLSESVEIMALANKIKAAFARAQTRGALNEEWDAFQDVKAGWPKSVVEDVTRAKDARKIQLANEGRVAG